MKNNSSKFIVSARKYRPQNFNTVVGQQHITTTLKNAIIQNQLAHAFLFTGPRGVGKTTCARILAKTVNCENITDAGEACNVCTSCQNFDKGASLNIHELDAASNNSVDDVRSLIEQVRFAPQSGKYKVYIVDEVHMLSAAAFNAFLKTLEEPPAYAIFILATTEKHKILPTILSRCQIFDFKRITSADMVTHLEEIASAEEVMATEPALHLIAQKSEGCMRDALSIFDKLVSFTGGNVSYENTVENLNILDDEVYFSLLQLLLQSNITEALLLYDDVNQKGFEADVFIEGFSMFLRNLLVSADAKAIQLLDVADSFKEKYKTTAAATDVNWVVAALQIAAQTTIELRQTKNKHLQIELMLIKLAYMQQALKQSSLGIGDAEKKKPITTKGIFTYKTNSFISFIPKLRSKQENTNTQTSAPSLHTESSNTDAPEVYPQNAAIPSVQEPKMAQPVPAFKPIVKLQSVKEKAKNILSTKNTQAKNITDENLPELIEQYLQAKTKNKRNNIEPIFNASFFQVASELEVLVTTTSTYNYKMMEMEKTSLGHHFQKQLQNNFLKLSIILKEATSVAGADKEKQLTNREKFEIMAQANPAIQLLKDSLNLEIDY